MAINKAFAYASLLAALEVYALGLGLPKDSKSESSYDWLAQTENEQTKYAKHTCSMAHNRNKADLVDFFAQTTPFTDYSFPTNDALYWADYVSEQHTKVARLSNRIRWVRAHKQFRDSSLWGENGIGPTDAKQGVLGNCWFMVVASALAEKQKRLERVFLNDKANPLGIYGVNLYTLGVPHTVIVDDYLPVKLTLSPEGKLDYVTLFSHLGDDGSLWGAILEKAFAKVYGNYAHLVSGDPRDAAIALNGSPSSLISHKNETGVSSEYMWSQLMKHDVNNEMMFYTTLRVRGRKTNSCGLQGGHAYVVLAAKQLSNGARIIQVRNPIGKERYTCAYSDESPLWTPALREEAGATEAAVNDGIFFMTLEDYIEQGGATIISYDTTGWHHDHFLMIGDDRKMNGSWSWCGATCTRHHIDITSEVDQYVYVTAHTWEDRSQPAECRKSNKVHSIYQEGSYRVYSFREGAKQMAPLWFKAGETNNYIVEFDWQRECVTPDWSVTAWAQKGAVAVEHRDKIQTDQLPFIQKEVIEAPVPALAAEPTPTPKLAPKLLPKLPPKLATVPVVVAASVQKANKILPDSSKKISSSQEDSTPELDVEEACEEQEQEHAETPQVPQQAPTSPIPVRGQLQPAVSKIEQPDGIETDSLQELLNDYVLTHNLGIRQGQCIFKIDQLVDPQTGKKVTVGGHNCKDYGINLEIYYRSDDWSYLLEREFSYVEPESGDLFKNVRSSCRRSISYTKCKYYLAPNNNRAGFLFDSDAADFLTYRARWVHDPYPEEVLA